MYSVRILRRAIKDIANLPKGYAHLVGQHIDRLEENPRPPDAKDSEGRRTIAYVWEYIAFSTT